MLWPSHNGNSRETLFLLHVPLRIPRGSTSLLLCFSSTLCVCLSAFLNVRLCVGFSPSVSSHCSLLLCLAFSRSFSVSFSCSLCGCSQLYVYLCLRKSFSWKSASICESLWTWSPLQSAGAGSSRGGGGRRGDADQGVATCPCGRRRRRPEARVNVEARGGGVGCGCVCLCVEGTGLKLPELPSRQREPTPAVA